MKTTENTSTTTSRNHHNADSTPFFAKEGQGSFFSEAKETEQPFFQPKLTIGQPNDKYEREADAIADRVVSGERSVVSGQAASGANPVQRKCAECGKEEDVVQPKLKVPSGELQRKAIFESNEIATNAPQGVQMKPSAAPAIQTKCADCEQKEKLQKKEEEVSETDLDIEKKPIFESQSEPPPEDNTLQRQSESGANTASPDLQSRLNSSKGGGQALPSSTQESMGSAMGADFSGVRVHTGGEAVQMNQELGAQAFTHGSDVYFNEGKYDAGSDSGQHLLAHELVHTVQQGGAKSNSIQKTEGEEQSEVKKVEVSGKGTFDKDTSEIVLQDLTIPKFKYDLIGTRSVNPLPKTGNRGHTEQVSIWENNLRVKVSDLIAQKITPQLSTAGIQRRGMTYFFLKSKKDPDNFLMGGVDQMSYIAVRPYWDKKGETGRYRLEVDHIMERQLDGPDHIDNLWLLDRTANGESGRIINRNISIWIREILKEARNKIDASLPHNREKAEEGNFTIKIESFKSGKNVGNPENSYTKAEIEEGKSINEFELMSIEEVQNSGLLGNEDESTLTIWLSKWGGESFQIKNWDIAAGTREFEGAELEIGRNMNVKRVNYRKGEGGKMWVEVFGIQDSDSKEIITSLQPFSFDILEQGRKSLFELGGYINGPSIQNAAEKGFDVSLFSPIVLYETGLNSEDGLYGRGKLLPTLSIMEKADIDVEIDGRGPVIKKTFTAQELSFPSIFGIDEVTLEMALSHRGLSASGQINFSIKNVGEGSVQAGVNSSGNFRLGGAFNIASDLFEESSVSVLYEKNANGEGEFIIGGKLTLGEGKVKGLKKAEADVSYDSGTETFSAVGKAEPNVKGLKEIEMILNISEEGYQFGGKMGLEEVVPLVKKGELELSVTKDAEGFRVNGGGFVEPDIAGLSGTRIQIVYDDGKILIEGAVPFQLPQANATGNITIGMTNQVVDENNNPTGEIADSWSVFGSGKVIIQLSKGIRAEAEVKLLENGDIVVSGKVGLDHSEEKNKEKGEQINYPLLKLNIPPIILLIIPPIATKLTLEIGGGINLYANYSLPYIEELSLSLIGFNITNPQNDEKIVGNVKVGMSAQAGVEFYLTLTAGLTVLIAKVTGTLKGSLKLEANAAAFASLEASWSKANGLAIEEGEISINANAQFIAELTGLIGVHLDLWLTSIKIWEEELKIARIAFGELFDVGFKLPILMNDGELAAGKPNKDSFEVPDINSESKQRELIEQAAKQDEKVKPPPPPSKKEAIFAVKKLDAGPIKVWDVIHMDGEEARMKVAFGWINRDTYLFWLKHKHKSLDWTEVFAASKEKDLKDYSYFEKWMYHSQSTGFYRSIQIESFKENHRFFAEKYPEKIMKFYQE